MERVTYLQQLVPQEEPQEEQQLLLQPKPLNWKPQPLFLKSLKPQPPQAEPQQASPQPLPQALPQPLSQATSFSTVRQTMRQALTFSQTGTHFVTQRVHW